MKRKTKNRRQRFQRLGIDMNVDEFVTLIEGLLESDAQLLRSRGRNAEADGVEAARTTILYVEQDIDQGKFMEGAYGTQE